MEFAVSVARYSFTIDAALMKRFEELAGPDEGDGAELLRSFIAHYIETLDSDEGYDSWLKAKVGESMATARAGGLVDDDEVETEFAARRKASLARLAAK